MSDVFPLSGISGLSSDFSFLSPLLFFCLVLLLFLSCLVIFLLTVHFPDFFLENSQTFLKLFVVVV